MLTIGESKMKEDSLEYGAELQAELLRLQRQYRYLADDRKAYRNEAEHTLKRQGQEITNLLLEESDMLKDMNLVQQRTNKAADATNLGKLNNLLDEEEVTKMAFEEETNKMISHINSTKKQEQQIEKLTKEVTGSCHDQEKRIKSAKKNIHTMENRLHQVTIKFNQVLARNASHRQSIEYIAVQRSRFRDLNKKLSRLYKHGTKEKDQLIDSSKALYTIREEADHRMKYLKDKSERDLASFNSELKDLIRIIDHDKKLRAFMKTKKTDLSVIYEQAVLERRDKNNLKMLQSEVEQYHMIFKRLSEVTGDSDVAAMVQKFIKTEDMNFAMFNYVNEQNMQCKQLQVEIEQLKVEAFGMGNFYGSMTKERKKICKEVENEFQRVSQLRIASSKSFKKATKLLVQAKDLTWSIFKKLGCESAGIRDMLGNSGITEDNMIQFLGVVEIKTNELLQIKLFIAIRENNEHEVAQLQSARTEQKGKEHQIITFMPPSVIVDTLESANCTRVSKRAHNDQMLTLQPLHEDQALLNATRSMSRLALQQEI